MFWNLHKIPTNSGESTSDNEKGKKKRKKEKEDKKNDFFTLCNKYNSERYPLKI